MAGDHGLVPGPELPPSNLLCGVTLHVTLPDEHPTLLRKSDDRFQMERLVFCTGYQGWRSKVPGQVGHPVGPSDYGESQLATIFSALHFGTRLLRASLFDG
jgi:hypothetical protein